MILLDTIDTARGSTQGSCRPLAAKMPALGIRHIELASQSGPSWIRECRELISSIPMDALGAASVHGPKGLQAAREAGLRDASSPVFDPRPGMANRGRGRKFSKKNSASGGVWKADGVNDRLPNSAELRR